MATDPSSLYAMLAQNSGQFGQYFQQGQQQAAQDQIDKQNVAQNALKLQQVQQQAANDAGFQNDWADYLKAPTTDKLARIAVKYPTHADAVKEFWSIKDPDIRQSHINQIAPPLAALQNNKPDLAIQSLQATRDATAKAGQPTDDLDSEISALQSGDQDSINAVKATMMMHLAAADPDGKFAESLSKAQKAFAGGDPYTLGSGETRYDGNNNVVARGAPKQMEAFHYTLKDAAGNDHEYIYDPSAGQPLPPGAVPAPGASGAAASVAPNGQLDPVAFYKQFVLPHEGGYAPHDANGAPVNHGINQSANPGVDAKNLSADDAAQIFATKYFPSSANLPPALAAVNADTAFINPKRAAQFLQASGGDPTKYMQMRQAWMNSLISKQPDTYAKYAKAWGTRNADLSAYAANLSGGGSAPSGGAPVSGGMPTAPISGSRQIDPNPVSNTVGADMPGDPNKQGDDYLVSLPAGLRSTVKAIANGQMAQPSSFALTKPYWQQVMAAVSQYDPTFDSSTQPQRVAAAKAFTGNGKAAQTLASIDRLSYHMNDLYRDSQALTGWNLGPASGIVNAGVQSFQKASLARYNAALPFIAGELQKLTKNGSATEGESKQIMTNLDPSQPASARLAAMQQLAELTQGQFKPIRDQWESAFPDGRPMPLDVSKEANAILDHVNNDKGPVPIDPHTGRIAGQAVTAPTRGASAAPAKSAPVRISGDADYARLASGAQFIGPDGQLRRKP